MKQHKIIATATASVLLLGAVAPAFAETSLTGSANAVVNAVAQGYGITGKASTTVQAQAGASSSTGLGASISNMLEAAAGSGASSTASNQAGATSSASTDVSVGLSLSRTDAMTMANASVTSATQVSNVDQLKVYVASQIRTDENVQAVESASNKVAVTYKQHAKFLGFIPVTLNARAEVDAAGNVEVKYPWYSIFAVTDRATIESKVQNSVNATLGTNGSLTADADASASLSVEQQAKVVAAVRAAMRDAFDAAADASGSASGTVEAGADIQGDVTVQ